MVSEGREDRTPRPTSPSCCSQRCIPHRAQSPTEQCLDYSAWLSAGRWMGRPAANDLSTHHSKTAAQSHYQKTIGRSDCHPIVRLSADTIVQLDYRPNPIIQWYTLLFMKTEQHFLFCFYDKFGTCVPVLIFLHNCIPWSTCLWIEAGLKSYTSPEIWCHNNLRNLNICLYTRSSQNAVISKLDSIFLARDSMLSALYAIANPSYPSVTRVD